MRLPFADERQREMRERREVAARPDRAARGHPRQHAAVQALEQQLDGHDARAGEPLRERVRAQQHRGADDVVGVRLADAARMAAQEAQLQLLGELLRNVSRDEAAEAGVDAVRVLPANALDELASRPHALTCRVGQLGRSSADRDLPHLGESQILARQDDRAGHVRESRSQHVLEDPRRVDVRDHGVRAVRRVEDARRDEPDELAGGDVHTACLRLGPHALDDVVQRRLLEVDHVHLTCTLGRIWQEEADRLHAGHPAARLREPRGDLARDLGVVGRRARRCRRRAASALRRARRPSAGRSVPGRRPARARPTRPRRPSSSSPPRRKNAGRRPSPSSP